MTNDTIEERKKNIKLIVGNIKKKQKTELTKTKTLYGVSCGNKKVLTQHLLKNEMRSQHRFSIRTNKNRLEFEKKLNLYRTYKSCDFFKIFIATINRT